MSYVKQDMYNETLKLLQGGTNLHIKLNKWKQVETIKN